MGMINLLKTLSETKHRLTIRVERLISLIYIISTTLALAKPALKNTFSFKKDKSVRHIYLYYI